MSEDWSEDIDKAPRDGTVLDVRFRDAKGLHPRHPMQVAWDKATECWRNTAGNVRIDATIGVWRRHRPHIRGINHGSR